MKRFFRDNGLSLALFALFLVSYLGQSVSGMFTYNEDQKEHEKPQVTYREYLTSDEFLEATAENWESEFLQLFTFVLLTRYLYQKGSPESMDPEKPEDSEEEEAKSKTAPEKIPWPARRGGLVLKLYEHSLTLTFFVLFLLSLALHAVGGAGEYNQEQREHGQREEVSVWGYLLTSTFWFQSLQNWQSEFLSIFAMVVFSIWLRERHSPESKPVYASHDHTGR